MNLREILARALSLDLPRARSVAACALRAPPASFDLIAVGKGAASTVDAALEAWGHALGAGLVVLPDGAPTPREHPRVSVLYASHPLPDERSVAAGEAALTLARDGGGGELHVHVSGGASSLLAAPIAGVTLQALREVIRALLLSGADVRAINVLRRHLSRSHGGALARAAWPRPTLTTVTSDVIGGGPHDVGSGPSVPDPTTVDDARRLLARYAPSSRTLPLIETLKPGDTEAARASVVLSLDPETLAEEVARALERANYAARVLAPSTADVAVLAAEYATLAQTLTRGAALVRCAEPSVRIDALHPGAGGRCTHVAALVARELPPTVQFMAAASDGVDGSSGTGGALVTARSFDPSALDAAIAAFDTGTLHRARGTALPCALTGVNFADLHVLLREADG